MSRPAKRITRPAILDDIILNNHQSMTATEMAEKFGHHNSSYNLAAKRLGVVLKDGRKPKEAKVVRIKPAKTPPVMKNRPIPEAKPRKESNSKNPDRFKVRKMDYSTMRMLPVGIDNQYFYVSQDAIEEEITQERARRRERIEAKKQRERLKPL